MQSQESVRPPRRRWTALAVAAAVAASSALTTAVLPVATAQAAPPAATRPWTKALSSGDYIADSYDGINAGHVLENVTTDRLLDILSSNGNYYIAFAGPEHAASQALLPAVNAAAKAKGITKIYHFDPYVDGYQLDSTLKNGVADVTGGTSTNFGGTAKISDVWTLITNLLPASTIATGGALADYAGDTAVLLNVNISNRKDANAGKAVTKLAELKAADVGAFNPSTVQADLETQFDGRTSSERTQFAFFERLYNASSTNVEGSTETADRIGSAVKIFDSADESGFALKSIDVKELYNLLNAPGESVFLFAGQGCHNTQAIIGSVAKRAKALNQPVYVVDFALDSNVKFGTGDAIDTASASSATGGLWIRSGSAALATTSPYRYGYSYLYGKLADYLGPNWITENSSKKNNSVAYYPNAVLGETSSVVPYSGGSDNAAFKAGVDVANATRLQVPTLVRYNKDAADPVVSTWLHKDNVADGKAQTYTEYMLELSWVRATAKAKADASRTTGRDGLTKVEFAAEAVASLDNVLKADGAKVTHQLTTTPTPTISGNPAVGGTLEGFWDDFSHNPSLSYQWLADGTAIVGATSDKLTLTTAEAGKRISFAITASRPTYEAVTTTSAQTGPVAAAGFTASPVPTITGNPKSGQALTALAAEWTPAASLAYQWNANGKPIAGATAPTYKLQPADVDARITVTVTGSASGFAATSVTSAPTGLVQGSKLTQTVKPKISGKAKVGKTLTAKPGSWKPKSGLKFSYQWYADGAAISGATAGKFKVAAAQKGKKITVSVTGRKLGYNAVTKASKATAKVK